LFDARAVGHCIQESHSQATNHHFMKKRWAIIFKSGEWYNIDEPLVHAKAVGHYIQERRAANVFTSDEVLYHALSVGNFMQERRAAI
jgi:hypothetical protein